MANLKELFKPFDAFGWIPTIKGSLSLDLIGHGKHLLGDVDKYAVEFSRHIGLSSCHYVAATSLLTVNDSKVGDEISRTFRYIFVGAISDPNTDESYFARYNIEEEDVKTYVEKEGVLFGKLLILTESDFKISDVEARLLQLMQNIVEDHNCFLRSFSVEAVSMKDLESQRLRLYNSWDDISSCFDEINSDENDQRPKYCFDVALTRDGLLLLKDTTSERYRDSYCKQGTADDYTQNVAIHRIFKVAMNYIKYLFHANYHHNVENDAFLPASNLHPARSSEAIDLSGVFRHQLNAFLNPITKMKRNGFSDYTMDANGIILYAKAFVNVFKENQLVEQQVANKASCFIDLQKQEVEHMTQSSRTLVNAVLTQHNSLLIFTGVLAFVVAVVKLLTTFVEFDRIHIENITSTDEYDKVVLYGTIVAFLFFVGYSIFYYTHSKVLSKRFVRKEDKNVIFCGNSNIKKRRFAYSYMFHIWKHSQMLIVGIIWSAIIKVLLWLILLSVVVISFWGIFY